MTKRPQSPPSPALGTPLSTARPCQETLDFLALRRTTPVARMDGPGPDADELDALLQIAARVPDHGKLAPWRFLVFEGDARQVAGRVLEKAARTSQTHLPEEGFALEAKRFMRAPIVVAVISRRIDSEKIPEWEQRLSAGAVCHQLILAASAMGYAGQWLTEWYANDTEVLAAFGLTDGEKIAGYVYLGSAPELSPERPRPDMAGLVSRWTGKA